MRKTEPINFEVLNYQELKDAARAEILGSGMAGSTQYLSFKKTYYDNAPKALQNRINTVLMELMEEVDPKTLTVGGRAIYICSEIQTSEMLKKLKEIERIINSKLDYIESAADLDSCIGLFEYIAEFNNAAGKLLLVGAKPVLVRQISKYTKENPVPLTKEYYLHHMCSKSALAALERIGSASE